MPFIGPWFAICGAVWIQETDRWDYGEPGQGLGRGVG